MQRKFLEDLGLEKEVIDKIMTDNGNAPKPLPSGTTTKPTIWIGGDDTSASFYKETDDRFAAAR